MKCGNLISYGPKAQVKIHKTSSSKTEICGGSIDVSIRAYDTERYGEEVDITYSCIKCHKEIPQNKMMNFPANIDQLRHFLIDKIAEK